MAPPTTVSYDPLTLATFRAAWPVFADPQEFNDTLVQMYITVAGAALDPNRWGEFYQLGFGLFVAHFLTLDAMDQRTADAGGIAGTTGGVVSSKSVGAASVSYDTSLGAEEDGGMWNLTTYGRRWLRFARLVGMGGFQSGGPDIILSPTFGSAWPGVVR